MTGTAHVTQACNPSLSKVPLHVERVVVRVFGGHMTGQRTQVCVSNGRQTSRVERGNHARIRRIPEDVRWAGRSRVKDIRIDLSWVLAGPGNRTGSRRVEVVVVRGCDLLLVVVQSIATTENQFSIIGKRTPVEANLRPEIEFLRLPSIDSGADRDAG